MAGALERGVGAGAAGEDMGVGVELVRAGQVARSRHRHCVVPAGAALGGEEIIPAVALVEMRRFGEAQPACR
jgi:hypothetical protein